MAAGGKHGQGADQSTSRAGMPWRMKGKREIKVEERNVTDRIWPGHSLASKDNPYLPSKHCWV